MSDGTHIDIDYDGEIEKQLAAHAKSAAIKGFGVEVHLEDEDDMKASLRIKQNPNVIHVWIHTMSVSDSEVQETLEEKPECFETRDYVSVDDLPAERIELFALSKEEGVVIIRARSAAGTKKNSRAYLRKLKSILGQINPVLVPFKNGRGDEFKAAVYADITEYMVQGGAEDKQWNGGLELRIRRDEIVEVRRELFQITAFEETLVVDFTV